MDSDHWSSRLAVAKRQFMLHQTNKSHSDRLFIDDLEVEDDIPCPYCYEDHDIASLCSHLEDEHSFESRVAVCPICSVKIARDMLGHITMQHRHLFKLQRRRRLRRVAIPNSQALSLLGRDLREAHLQVLLGGGGYRPSNANASNSLTESLLSSLVLNFPLCEAEEITKSVVPDLEDISGANSSKKTWNTSVYSSLSSEEREKKIRQTTARAGFIQDLLISTMFDD
ncbi:hypothetical protein VitviT2T_029509 [Vitis vinifera]|uniref:Uncharacterized protein n=1 Tax=Vitis vinifera TaxID=29760 RepID=A0ABY9DWF1_VITVI|nr:protein DEHYDRATION-INDUCED 19 homolog 4 [Vitis vinifera]WKA12083.1 hypothetical protein VitviT2T_029509 [Vitis vinifera]|eukprot:XP_002285172.1 PREDICTED: protein DEHYDRATION-INDUCED 19 homolog 4 [Vitis vinifera]